MAPPGKTDGPRRPTEGVEWMTPALAEAIEERLHIDRLIDRRPPR